MSSIFGAGCRRYGFRRLAERADDVNATEGRDVINLVHFCKCRIEQRGRCRPLYRTTSPLPAGGLTFNGGPGADGLQVDGNASANTVTVTSASLTYDTVPLNYTSLTSLGVLPGTGADSITINSGTLTITPGGSTTQVNPVTFSSLAISAGAKLLVASPSVHAGRTVLIVSNLSDAGALDLGGNDMIVRSGSLSAITALAATGYAGGTWTGAGLSSYAAANDTSYLTALGVIQASAAANTSTFDGITIASTDVLVKYTYYGDANLDGTVNQTDEALLDAGYNGGLTGWANGDFNYDGVVNGTDYTFFDNGYNNQGSPM